jgi:nucleotide-binding universal stress UspA family protein
MFTNVVVALKEGVSPAPLVELALKSTEPPAKLHLVTLVVIVGTQDDELARLKSAQDHLERVAEPLIQQGYMVETHVGPAPAVPGHFINQYASDESADLIVIGLAKRSRVGKALMGSDAQRVLLGATTPVLSVPMH